MIQWEARRFGGALRGWTAVGLLIVLAATRMAAGAGYFVSLQGRDDATGRSRETAFRTIQKGVSSLQTGDVLTIAPGEYFETVRRDKLGGLDADTVIRAEVPGTVLIRGDVPLPAFRKVDGYRFVYEADVELPGDVQAVNDLDALRAYPCLPSLPGLDFRPGSFHNVAAAKKLYVITADFSPADTRRFTASLRNEAGIELRDAKRLRLEGLSVTGFRDAGILLSRPRRCVVSDCRAYLNSRGIQIDSQATGGPLGGGNSIEHCIAWANQGDGLSANVQNDDTIRHSLAFLNGGSGMFLYAGAPQVSRMHDNLAWGNGSDFFMKSGISRHQVERCTGPGRWPHESGGSDIRHCLLGLLDRGPRKELDFVNNIQLLELMRDKPDIDWGAEFADPANHDYRLQATSRFRGSGAQGSDLGAYPFRPNIFYLSPKGSDAADGLSVARAWATLERAGRELKPGDTLYLSPGRYAGRLRIAGKPGEGRLQVRGRGAEAAELAGPVAVEDARGISFERLRFAGPIVVSGGGGVVFEQCSFAEDGRLSLQRVNGLRVVHCGFSGGGDSQVALAGCSDVYLSGNRFENARGVAVAADRPEAVLYSDYNAYRLPVSAWRVGSKEISLDRLPGGWERYGTSADNDARMASASGPYGRAVGPYRPDPGLVFRMVGPFVHAVGATSANIEWFASHRARIVMDWGTTPACTNGVLVDRDRFGTDSEEYGGFSLTGLQPNTTYYVKLRSVQPVDTPRALTGVEWSPAPVPFKTATEYPAPYVYHVAPDGDDAADGLSPERSLRTITRAAALVRPGDTVRVAGGVYHECLYVRATGLPGRPITFSSRLGERVVLDGGVNREMNSLLVAFDKSYLRIDGFYMRNVTGEGLTAAGVIRWFGGQDVRITRVLQEDRVNGWPAPFFNAWNVSDMLVRNCVSVNTMGGPTGGNAPRLRMENCALLRNRIGGVQGGWASRPEFRSVLLSNIITDCQANKIHQPIGPLRSSDVLVLRNNAYFLRPERRVQLDHVMNMAEFEEQVLRDGGMIGDTRFAGLHRAGADLPLPGFGVDAVFGTKGDLTFANFIATNPEFIRRGIGLNPDDFRGFEGGPLSVADLIRLSGDLPPQPDIGFGSRYRAALKALLDRAARQPSDSLRHELREAFVAADAARQTRRDADILLVEAQATLARPYMGDAARLHKGLSEAIAALAVMLRDGAAEIEAVRGKERMLRAAVADYDAGRLIQVRLPAAGWRFRTDPQRAGREDRWFSPAYGDGAWRSDVPIEANWQDHMKVPYFGDAWYRRRFDAPPIPDRGVRVWLNFHGVDEEAWVWLNGAYVGAHTIGPDGWQVPFQLDVTDHVKPGAANQITVMVRNTAGQGGIWKAIYLNVRDASN